jgi:hypothetical protein
LWWCKAQNAQSTRRYGNCNQPFSAAANLKTFSALTTLRGALPSQGCSIVTTQTRYQRGSRGWRTDSAATAIPAARRSAAFATRPRFIDLELTAAGHLSIQACDRLGRFLIVRHFDESESSRSPGLAIHRHVHTRHGAKRFEQRTQLTLTRLKIQISHEQTLHLPFSSG